MKYTALLPLFFMVSFQGMFAQSVHHSKQKEPITAAGHGIQLDEIEEIVLRPTTTGTGFGVTLKVRPYVLLKDGTMYSRPDASPHDLDVSRSKQQDPSKWGTWTRNGNALNINFKSPQNITNYYKTVRAETGASISGCYKMVGTFPASTIHDFNTICFNSDKTFVWRYFYRNDGRFIPHSTDRKIKGSYHIEDYTIIMTYENGTVERHTFAKFAIENGVLIGSQAFAEFTNPGL